MENYRGLIEDMSPQDRQVSNTLTLLPSPLRFEITACTILDSCGRNGGPVVSVLDSGSSGLALRPGRSRCFVFLGKTLNSLPRRAFLESPKNFFRARKLFFLI